MAIMDSKDDILRNVRDVLGCSGVLRFEDLAPMRQETVERRLTAAEGRLQPASVASIYAVWLQEQACRHTASPPPPVVERWCRYLARRGCGKAMLQVIWMQAALSVLDKWCDVMSPERVRDVRRDVYDAIAAAYPGGQGSPMGFDGATSSGPSACGRSGVASDDAMEVDARGAGAVVRAAQDPPSESGSELTGDENTRSFSAFMTAKTQQMGDHYKMGGVYFLDSTSQEAFLTFRRPRCYRLF